MAQLFTAQYTAKLPNCIVEGNSPNIIGSLVNKYSLGFNGGTIRKGNLPKIFEIVMELQGSVIPGSYIE